MKSRKRASAWQDRTPQGMVAPFSNHVDVGRAFEFKSSKNAWIYHLQNLFGNLLSGYCFLSSANKFSRFVFF